MTLSNLLTSDSNILRSLGADEFLINDVATNPLYVNKLLIEDDEAILGVSLVRVTSELTLLLNSNAHNITRAKAIALLLSTQKSVVRNLGINQVHVWTDINPNTMKHFGFNERQERSYIIHI